MSDSVDQLIEERRQRRHRRGQLLALAAAAGLHGAVVAAVLVLPALGEPQQTRQPDFPVVRVVPLQALGQKEVAPAPEPAAPRPQMPQPEPEPEPEPEPPKPQPKPPAPKPEPQPPTPQPQPAERAPEPRSEPPARNPPAGNEGSGSSRRGSPTGSPAGSAAFGSRLGVDDPSFRHDYYLERIAALIESEWSRPPAEGVLEVVVHFRIEQDGEVVELEVIQPSGHNPFDLAALRAVNNAAPLPPLPRSYRKDSLGINLIFR